jgi:DNA-binding Lrp family transcriptional regulator
MLFTIFRKLVTYERETLPFVKTGEDRAIVFALMAAQENGQQLTLKQLSQFRIGAPATLRRRMARLQRLGVIQKAAEASDRRLKSYSIGKRYQKYFQLYEQAAKAVSYLAAMNVSGLAEGVCGVNKPIIDDARNPEQVAERLREKCHKYGQIKSITLTCSHERNDLFVMMQIDGQVSAAANALGGIVFGATTVCVTLPLPAGFRCEKNKSTGTCLKVFS